MQDVRHNDPEDLSAREDIRVQKVFEQRDRVIPPDRYSLLNSGNARMQRERDERLLRGLSRFELIPFTDKKVLDVGCGLGYSLLKFLKWGAKPEHLFGVDLVPAYIEQARRSLPSAVTVQVGTAADLPFVDASFDLVAQSTVFSSILHQPTKQRVAAEITRALKPGGFLIWYDFFRDNPWNSDVRGVTKRDVKMLFPGYDYHFERLTVAAPLSRRLCNSWPQAYPLLACTKILCTHYLAFLRKQ